MRTSLIALLLPVPLVALCVLIPPLQVPDEPAHFFRAYQISEGAWVSEKGPHGVGGRLPYSLHQSARGVGVETAAFHADVKFDPAVLEPELRRPLDPAERRFLSLNNTALYSPVPYAAPALWMTVGRWFEAPPYVLLLLGRFGSLAASLAILGLAFCLLPAAWQPLAACVAMPMYGFLLCSLSPDGVTVALSVLLVACCWRYWQSARPSGKLYISSFLVFALLACCKQVYGVCGLFTLLLLQRDFAIMPRGKALVRYGVGSVLSLLPLVIWTSLIGGLYMPMRPEVATDPAAQLAHVREQPLAFLGLLVEHLGQFWQFYLHQYTGVLGWLDAPLPQGLVFFFTAAPLLLAAFRPGGERELPGGVRLLACSIILGCVLAVSLVVYATWNPPGVRALEGIQGRYFLPMACFAYLAVHGILHCSAEGYARVSRLACGIPIFSVATVYWVVVHRYYLS